MAIELMEILGKDLLPGDVIDNNDHFDIVEDVILPSSTTGSVVTILASRVWITQDHFLREQSVPVNCFTGIRATLQIRRVVQ